MKHQVAVLGLIGAAFVFSACGKKEGKGTPTNLPLVAPPVKNAVAKGLQSPGPALMLGTFSDGIKSRFFEAGPTSVFRILTTIDERIAEINNRSKSSGVDCVSQAPVPYTIKFVDESVSMFAQCFETLSGGSARDPQLLQFGVKDGVTYLYFAIGTGRVAVVSTPNTNPVGTSSVKAWLSVGTLNPSWDSGSYGVMKVSSDEANHKFEMAVAGLGFGYCGAQLKSDSENVYFTGSTDMGSTCNAVESSCVSAADASTPATCSAALSTFDLVPLGRKAAQGSATLFAASQYPVAPNVTFNGTATDAAFFGPNAPTEGVGKFEGKK